MKKLFDLFYCEYCAKGQVRRKLFRFFAPPVLELPAAEDGGILQLGLDIQQDFLFRVGVLLLVRFRLRRIRGFLQGALLLFQGPLVHLLVRTDALDDDGTDRPVQPVGLDAGDPVDDVESADGLAEDGIFPVQVLAVRGILDQVELGAGRFPHRVGQVAAAGGGQGPFLVPVLRQDFRVDGVAGAALAPFLDPRGVPRVRPGS